MCALCGTFLFTQLLVKINSMQRHEGKFKDPHQKCEQFICLLLRLVVTHAASLLWRSRFPMFTHRIRFGGGAGVTRTSISSLDGWKLRNYTQHTYFVELELEREKER